MFGENLKRLRKQKGYSQEELAARLHVVRQTISKWEKGLSVPDAALLMQLSEMLEVPVQVLLDDASEASEYTSPEPSSSIAEQLSRLNAHLAERNSHSKKIWRIVGIVLLCSLVLMLLLILLNVVAFQQYRFNTRSPIVKTESVQTEVFGETKQRP